MYKQNPEPSMSMHSHLDSNGYEDRPMMICKEHWSLITLMRPNAMRPQKPRPLSLDNTTHCLAWKSFWCWFWRSASISDDQLLLVSPLGTFLQCTHFVTSPCFMMNPFRWRVVLESSMPTTSNLYHSCITEHTCMISLLHRRVGLGQVANCDIRFFHRSRVQTRIQYDVIPRRLVNLIQLRKFLFHVMQFPLPKDKHMSQWSAHNAECWNDWSFPVICGVIFVYLKHWLTFIRS